MIVHVSSRGVIAWFSPARKHVVADKARARFAAKQPARRPNPDPQPSRSSPTIRRLVGKTRGVVMLKQTRSFVFASILLPLLAVPTVGAVAKPIVEVAFVLDTTGSMGPLIEGAKRKIWSIATSILECNPDAEIRMGLVAYRDIGDDYVTKTFNLTTDIQDIYANLLELKAHGGGDWPESVNEALYVAVTKLAWTSGPATTRIMFLVGDAPPHMDYAQDTKYPEVMAMARRRHIIVNAVQAGAARDTERVWREIAQMADGRYIAIPQDGGALVSVPTPYDDEIIEMQKHINGTVLPYGPRQVYDRVTEQRSQVERAPTASATDLAAFMNKRNSGAPVPEAVTGTGDLVADVAAGRQNLGDVKTEHLPETVRNMSPDERKAYVAAQLERRKAFASRMSDLVRKRDQFIVEARRKAPGKTGDSFDRAVEDTLKTQIVR
jgi:hypothetical protein